MSRRADGSRGKPFRKTADGRTATCRNACPFPGPASSVIPSGAINAKSSTLNGHRRHRRSRNCRPRPIGSATQRGGSQCRARPWRFRRKTSWKPVADILTKKGYNVTLVENPLTSLAADVDATKQALAKQDGKTVLVGHSWGGVVITQAGNDPKVSALVYVSAFAPDVGQSLATLANSGPATEGTAAIHPDEKGNLYIDPKVFPSAVAADLPPMIAESLANSQLPLNHTAYEAPVDTAAWHDKPTFYVISTKDKVIAPEVQKIFATRMHAQTAEVAGSHASLVVHAKEVAAVIEEAARSE